MTAAFKLSAQLKAHSSDVRGVAAASKVLPSGGATELVLSVSRDATAALWSRTPGATSWTDDPFVLTGHEGFVNASAFLKDETDTLHAITGGQDKTINAYIVKANAAGKIKVSSSPDYTLLGHEDNVCALDVSPTGSYIVSGSWDKTAKVWKGWECIATFKGHMHAVWAVMAIDEDRIATASADKTIRVWSISKPDKAIATFIGHDDAVRGLLRIAGTDSGSFASCGNDSNILLYSLSEIASGSSKPLATLSGHTSFVYSLAEIPGGLGEFASSGEDRSVRIWRDSRMIQTITIPAISAWCVTALGNGDVACGSSDGFVRIFTRDPARVASNNEIQAYDNTIASQALNKAQVGDVQKESLPGPEGLQQPGAKEGQTKMIRRGELVEAHQWNAASGQWTKIGEVVGGVGGGTKKLYEGKEYDYVFDVDIADGVPPLKLPYNLSENPYTAAQRFLNRNELPASYIDQVVKFIEENSAAVNLGQTEYVDPYTGASRYAAGTPQQQAQQQQAYVDPYTGNGYRSGPPPRPAPEAASGSSAPSASSTGVIPSREYLSFKTVNLDAIKNKIVQFDSELTSSGSNLSDMESARLQTFLDLLATAARSGFPPTPLDTSVLEGVLSRWPLAARFPLLDLYRFTALGACSSPADSVCVTSLAASELGHHPEGSADVIKTWQTNNMLALRAVANVWSSSDPTAVGSLSKNLSTILDLMRQPTPNSNFKKLNKNGRVAYATVLLNISVFAVRSTQPLSIAPQLVEAIIDALSQEDSDAEVVYRCLVAAGNLGVSKSSSTLTVGTIETARDLGQAWATQLANEPRIADVVKEIRIS